MKFEFEFGTNEFPLSDVLLKNNLYSLNKDLHSTNPWFEHQINIKFYHK